jgi:hypothetical protein
LKGTALRKAFGKLGNSYQEEIIAYFSLMNDADGIVFIIKGL